MSLIDDLYALISSPVRVIGTIIPDVVVEEHHRDQLVITDHPVERGAAISDHAFKLPVEVEIRCGFSNSSAGIEGYVQAVYQEFLYLQASRVPFDVFTGKRQYSNMLIRSLEVTTDERSEHALYVVAALREAIIVDTATTSAPAQSVQASPQKTASVVNTGAKQITGPIQAAGG
ncbi:MULTISPECIES: phage baseplate protein [unclassified Rhizobium]|uniref:phage baseplate protein n=1 Tax=unclassified Rhizobium TaxID=2613769 RepID=UPI00382AF0C4